MPAAREHGLLRPIPVKPPPAGPLHFNSCTDLWTTPQGLFDDLSKELVFTLDVCADPDMAKCPHKFTLKADGLAQRWSRPCWMNPLYGKAIRRRVRKAEASAVAGATVVRLLPARADPSWWHDFVTKAEQIQLVWCRLQFGTAGESRA